MAKPMSPTAPSSIEISRKISPPLSVVHQNLLALAYSEQMEWKPYVEEEFGAGLSGARTLLVTFVGYPQPTPHVAKLGSTSDISRELAAYDKYVKPLADVHKPTLFLNQPVVDTTHQQAILIYKFVGAGQTPPVSLSQRFLQSIDSAQIVAPLERLLDYYRIAWANQAPNHDLFSDGFYHSTVYDRLLPPYLFGKQISKYKKDAEVLRNHDFTIHDDVLPLKSKSQVLLQIFTVGNISEDTITLVGTSRAVAKEGELRINVKVNQPDGFLIDQQIPEVALEVTETRSDFLNAKAKKAIDSFEVGESEFSYAGTRFPNPLEHLPALLLDRGSQLRRAIAHGDLNLNNILFYPDPKLPLAWLIDFEKTGPSTALFDYQRLETDLITNLLPKILSDAKLPETEIVNLLHHLHCTELPATVPHKTLQRFYDILRCVRTVAAKVRTNETHWKEYYHGLAIAMIGTYKFRNLDGNLAARKLALLAAATAIKLMNEPIGPPSDPPIPNIEPDVDGPSVELKWRGEIEQDKFVFVRILLECQTMRDPNLRGALIRQLPSDISNFYHVGPTTFVDTLSLVERILSVKGGITKFIRILRQLEGSNTAGLEKIDEFLR